MKVIITDILFFLPVVLFFFVFVFCCKSPWSFCNLIALRLRGAIIEVKRPLINGLRSLKKCYENFLKPALAQMEESQLGFECLPYVFFILSLHYWVDSISCNEIQQNR